MGRAALEGGAMTQGNSKLSLGGPKKRGNGSVAADKTLTGPCQNT